MHGYNIVYPKPYEIYGTNFIPDSLKPFSRKIFSEKNADVKIESVGHAIVQAA